MYATSSLVLDWTVGRASDDGTSPRLKGAGPVLLADDYFRIAHDDVTGKPRLNGRAIGPGLAAALVAELICARKVTVWEGQIHVLDDIPPMDPLGHTILDQLLAEPQHRTVRTWLDFLSNDAHEQVAHRLWRAGSLRKEESRRLLRPSVRWVPTDLNEAHWPVARIAIQLRDQRPMSEGDIFLAALCMVTGLDPLALRDVPAAGHRYLQNVVAGTPLPLRGLLAETETAVGDSVSPYRP